MPCTISEPITGWRDISCALVIVERARLVEDCVGNGNFAHVVEEEPELELGGEDQLVGELARDLEAVGGHALGVLAGVGVARLDGVGQGTHRGHVGAAKLLGAGALLLERLAQVGGVALELKLLVGRLALTPAQLGAQTHELVDQADFALDRHLGSG